MNNVRKTTPTAMEATQSFDIVPVVFEDIPRITQIHVITCMADNAFALYFDSAEEFTKRVSEMLQGQVGDPTWYHAKAVDKATGVLAAWASWNTPSDQQIRDRDASFQSEPVLQKTAETAVVSTNNRSEKEQLLRKGEFDFPAGLPQHVQRDTNKWINEWTFERRHILLKALFTDPVFQCRGMGNALVDHGNRMADHAALPILLQASAYGWSIYVRQGFKVVQHFDVDLRQWAQRAENNDKGYGNYRFRYMIRLPITQSLNRVTEATTLPIDSAVHGLT